MSADAKTAVPATTFPALAHVRLVGRGLCVSRTVQKEPMAVAARASASAKMEALAPQTPDTATVLPAGRLVLY